MEKKRPVNLDLRTVNLPLPAYTSILHRLSGILLFFVVGGMIYALELSLESPESFQKLQNYFLFPWVKFAIWFSLSGFIYHFIAGIKHLLMDIGIGESLEYGKLGSILTLTISLIIIILVGVWLW